MIAFGPVPSRRLGRSLGINNIPPKVCSFSCVYCQVGKTTSLQADRTQFYAPEAIVSAAEQQVERAQRKGARIDYLAFVPDGEPTLDANLGKEIELLKSLGIKVAVITNSSLIWREDVREDLAKADWVSVKIDSVAQKSWRRINRPQRTLKPEAIWGGLIEFADSYAGTLVTETMLVRGLNDNSTCIGKIADFLNHMQPFKAYIAVPTRPPAEKWVRPPAESVINEAFQRFSKKPLLVEYLIGYEGNAFAYTGDVEKDLLSITAVHPMRQDAVNDFLRQAGEDWQIVRKLIAKSQLIEADYKGRKFYMRDIQQTESAKIN